MQKFGHFFPAHSGRMKSWRDKYEHHLLLKMAGGGVAEAQNWLSEYFKTAEGDFACTLKKAARRFCTALRRLARRFVIRRYMPMK
jgi:D-lactate dehydrogenase